MIFCYFHMFPSISQRFRYESSSPAIIAVRGAQLVANRAKDQSAKAKLPVGTRSDLNPTGSSSASHGVVLELIIFLFLALANRGPVQSSKTLFSNPLGLRRTCLGNHRFTTMGVGGGGGVAAAADLFIVVW